MPVLPHAPQSRLRTSSWLLEVFHPGMAFSVSMPGPLPISLVILRAPAVLHQYPSKALYHESILRIA